MRLRWTLILCLLFILFLPHRARAENYALLVGIDKYSSPDITPLEYSVADVRAVAQALRENAGFAPEKVKVMTSDLEAADVNYPTHINVLKRLNVLARAIGPDDRSRNGNISGFAWQSLLHPRLWRVDAFQALARLQGLRHRFSLRRRPLAVAPRNGRSVTRTAFFCNCF